MLDQLAIENEKGFCDSAIEYEEKTDHRLKNSDTIILSGTDIKISVRYAALLINHGRTHIPQDEKMTQLDKGVHHIKHIIIISETGYITLDALSWCEQQEISLCVMNRRGELTFSSNQPNSNVNVRKAQYTVTERKKLEIAINFIREKTHAQIDTLLKIGASEAIMLLELGLKEVAKAKSINQLMQIEGKLAAVYFDAFSGFSLKWNKPALKVIPTHWLTITDRRSLLAPNGNGRRATNPYHAALNYTYSLLENQIRQAINTSGLDPACGFLHANKQGRDSLVFDLIEQYRAKVDELVFDFFSKITLKCGDCIQTETGECRLNPQLTRYLAASCRINQSSIDGDVKGLVGKLL